jgi:hypothetical protein
MLYRFSPVSFQEWSGGKRGVLGRLFFGLFLTPLHDHATFFLAMFLLLSGRDCVSVFFHLSRKRSNHLRIPVLLRFARSMQVVSHFFTHGLNIFVVRSPLLPPSREEANTKLHVARLPRPSCEPHHGRCTQGSQARRAEKARGP